jgi:RNA-binding protein Luc7-like 2
LTMTDAMREMIAQLMGASREAEEGRKLPPYDHHSVCRAYLLESCPREILTDTRLEGLIACRKMHEPAHKADYNKAQEARDHFYDIEAFEAIEDAVKTIDHEIDKTREKIKKDSENSMDTAEFIKTQKIFELNEKIGTTLVEVERLGSEGKVNESMELAKTVDELKRKKRELESEMRATAPTQQRLRVCEACGAQLNILDHESRLADHYGGKMHLGMVDIREKYEDMKKTIDERREKKKEVDDAERRDRRERSPDRRERRDYEERSGSNRDDRRRDKKRSRSPREDRRRSRSPRKSDRRDRSDRRDGSRDRRRSRY